MVPTTHVKFSRAFSSIAHHVFAVQRSSPHEGSILLDVHFALFLLIELRPVFYASVPSVANCLRNFAIYRVIIAENSQ